MKRPLIFKELERKRNFSDNHRKNISRLFQILAKLLFPTSGRKLDFYHQKVNLRVA